MIAAMFTGLVQAVGEVVEARQTGAGASLLIRPRAWDHRPAPGDSISVSGCCLTVAEVVPPGPGAAAPASHAAHADWRFDVVAQTLSKTTLGALGAGSLVNLEHAVRADSLMGGHFVQGHVDGVGRVTHVQNDPMGWRVRVQTPAELRRYLTPQGSIALEGVSLTIAQVTDDGFEVALIPTTLAKTTLGALRAGDQCNLEADVMAKMVVGWLEKHAGVVAPTLRVRATENP